MLSSSEKLLTTLKSCSAGEELFSNIDDFGSRSIREAAPMLKYLFLYFPEKLNNAVSANVLSTYFNWVFGSVG